MIAWSYLDKRTATVAALRDYNAMKNIFETTPQAVKEEYEEFQSTHCSQLNGLPKAHNPQAGEEKIAKSLDKIDVLQQRYRQAKEFMDWFEPAWSYLSDTEQLVLMEFYMSDSLRSGATARLQVKLGYSERYVDKIRGRSLGKLTKMLYGG